jgi:hypothetical protein
VRLSPTSTAPAPSPKSTVDVAASIGELEAGGVDLSADDQDVACRRRRLHPGVGDAREAVDEAGALVADVEGGHAGQAELVAEEAAGAGER